MAVLEPAAGQIKTQTTIRRGVERAGQRKTEPALLGNAVELIRPDGVLPADRSASDDLPTDDLPADVVPPHCPLVLAPELSLPLEAVTETFAILAKRGSGKTYTAAVLVEEMLKAGQTVVVADPVGVWWGLRSSADGRASGLPIAILGGDHADAPLLPGAGAAVADLAAEERLSLVLDLSHFTPPEQTRFMTGFAERLYRRNRLPLHLVLDEADQFVPQVPEAGQQPLLWAMNRIVRLGRARGLGVTLISQRPAVLAKNVLTQAEVLITLRLTSPQDRKAVEAWVSAHDAPERRREMLASLASLPVGTAWLWSPGWLDRLVRMRVRCRETFDSSATPKVGQGEKVGQLGAGQILPELAPMDLDRLRARLAVVEDLASVEESLPEDAEPAELRRRLRASQERVAALERRIGAGPVTVPAAPVVQRVEVVKEVVKEFVKEVVRRVEVPALEAGQAGQLREAASELSAKADALQADAGRLEDVARAILLRLDRIPAPPVALPVAAKQGTGKATEPEPEPDGTQKPDGTQSTAAGEAVSAQEGQATPSGADEPNRNGDEGKSEDEGKSDDVGEADGKMPLAERKILTALARYPEGRRKNQVALLTGYAVSGGGFNNALSSLRSGGRITGRDILKILDAGRAALGPHEPLPHPGPALVEAWAGRLPKAERLILLALAQAHPGSLTKEQLGAATGYEPAGGGFNNALSRVRTLALIEGRGELRASDALCLA